MTNTTSAVAHATHQSAIRTDAEQRLLDAAERLLVAVGYAGVTTRAVAHEAGVNNGLVHYYFGSMENLLVRVLERFSERLLSRQRAMYEAEVPFLDKWRQAVRYLDADRDYQKVWYELQALAWNRPELRARVARVEQAWRAVLRDALTEPHARYAIPMPLDALVALVVSFNEGFILERLSGIETGQAELLAWIDAWIEGRR